MLGVDPAAASAVAEAVEIPDSEFGSHTAAGALPYHVSAVVDTRLIQKPKTFGRDEGEWSYFRFSFENWLACVSFEYVDEMEHAAKSVIPVEATDASVRARSVALYAVLATILEGRILGVVKKQSKVAMDLRLGG